MEADPGSTGQGDGQHGDSAYQYIFIPNGVEKINQKYYKIVPASGPINHFIAFKMAKPPKPLLILRVWSKLRKFDKFLKLVICMILALALILAVILTVEYKSGCRTLEFGTYRYQCTSWFGGLMRKEHFEYHLLKQPIPGLACFTQEEIDGFKLKLADWMAWFHSNVQEFKNSFT